MSVVLFDSFTLCHKLPSLSLDVQLGVTVTEIPHLGFPISKPYYSGLGRTVPTIDRLGCSNTQHQH
jgi:hypothetical protein